MTQIHEVDALSQLQAEIAALHAKVASQEVEIANLKASQVQQLATRTTITTSRRRMLKKLWVSAAGLASLGAVNSLAQIPSVEAANGDSLIIASSNNSPNTNETTSLSLGANANNYSPVVLRVNNILFGGSNISLPSNTFIATAGVTGGPTSPGPLYVGVYGGASPGGYGVYGETGPGGGAGVYGKGTGGISVGVHAEGGLTCTGDMLVDGSISVGQPNPGVAAVTAHTASPMPFSIGILASSDGGYGGKFQGGVAPILIGSSSQARTSSAHSLGEFFLDAEGLWFCIQGTPGIGTPQWRKLAGSSTAGTLHLLTPNSDRLVDTRASSTIPTGGRNTPLPATSAGPGGTTYSFQIGGTTGREGTAGQIVPVGATAIVGNLTVIPVTPGQAAIKLLPSGVTDTSKGTAVVVASSSNVFNSFNAVLGATGVLKVAVIGTGSYDLIIDVVGYYL